MNRAGAGDRPPLWKRPDLQDQILGWDGPSLFVIGTADSHYDPALIEQMARRGEIVTLEGADHILEVPGDMECSLRDLEWVIRASDDFIPGDSTRVAS